jgi:hypothetical protein
MLTFMLLLGVSSALLPISSMMSVSSILSVSSTAQQLSRPNGGNSAGLQRRNLPDLLALQSLLKTPAMQPRDAGTWAAFGSVMFLDPRADEADELMMAEDTMRSDALAWVEQYAMRQALFAPKDVQQLRRTLAAAPAATVNRWWQTTDTLRSRFDSEQWRTTQRWLNQFLAAQAIYSSAEMATLHARLATRTPDELMMVLDHFEEVRALRQQRQALTEQQRQLALANVQRMQSPQQLKPAATMQPHAMSRFPTVNAVDTPRMPRRRPLPYNARSLSQRVADIYIYQSVFGDDAVWAWGLRGGW